MKFKIEILEDICKGCGLCVSFCPKQLFKISEKINIKGYHPAEWIGRPYFISEEKFEKLEKGKKNLISCVGCGVCYNVCPEAAIKIYKEAMGVEFKNEKKSGK